MDNVGMREMTLDEVLAKVHPEHRARLELAELRAALQIGDWSAYKAWEENRALKAELEKTKSDLEAAHANCARLRRLCR